jgi:hypothetical protein
MSHLLFNMESSSQQLENLEIMKRIMHQQFKPKDLLSSICVKVL